MLSRDDEQRTFINSKLIKDIPTYNNESSNKSGNIYLISDVDHSPPSHYEHLNSSILTQHDVVIQHNPYQGLNNDVWNDIFPLDKKPVATNVQRLNSDIWEEIFPVDIHSSLGTLQEYPSLLEDSRTADEELHSFAANSFIHDAANETSQSNSTSSSSFYNGCAKPDVGEKTSNLYGYLPPDTELPEDAFTNSELDQKSNKVFTINNVNLGMSDVDDIDGVFISDPIYRKDKQSSVSSFGEVYDTINDYDYIPFGDLQLLSADEIPLVNDDRRINRPLPSIPLENLPNSNTNPKNSVLRRKCICIVAIALLVIAVGASVAAVVNKFTKGGNNGVRIPEKNEASAVNISANTNDPENTLDARLFLHSPSLIKIINGNEKISGIAVLGSEIFTVEDKSSYVNVYNTDDFKLIRTIHLNGSLNLASIIASPRSKCLFISDTKLNAIYRYNRSNNAVMHWTPGPKCYGLSLTSTGNVLATLYDIRKLVEYTPDGQFIKEINLNETIENPWHSIQLSNNRFVVCHGNNEPLHRVCIVDEVGCIVNCSGGHFGSGPGMYNRPEYMALDSFGNILVSEEFNSRISMLDSSLNHLGFVTMPSNSAYQLRNPWTFCLDKAMKRLYIGDFSIPGRVFVLAV